MRIATLILGFLIVVGAALAQTAVNGYFIFVVVGEPPAPASGRTAVYVGSSTGKLCFKASSGAKNCVGDSLGRLRRFPESPTRYPAPAGTRRSFDVVHSHGLWEYVRMSDVAQEANEVRRVGRVQVHSIDTAEMTILPEPQCVTVMPRSWWEEALGLQLA